MSHVIFHRHTSKLLQTLRYSTVPEFYLDGRQSMNVRSHIPGQWFDEFEPVTAMHQIGKLAVKYSGQLYDLCYLL